MLTRQHELMSTRQESMTHKHTKIQHLVNRILILVYFVFSGLCSCGGCPSVCRSSFWP